MKNSNVIDVTAEEVSDDDGITLPQVREEFEKGILAIESGLFTHAQTQHKRLGTLTTLINTIESKFTKDFVDKLKPAQQIQFYELIRDSVDNAVTFLQDMHKLALETSSILKLIDSLEKLGDKVEKELPLPADEGLLSAIRIAVKDYVQKEKKN